MRLTQFTAADRVRAFGHVIIAGIYFYIAQSISVHAAHGLASGAWAPLVERSILLFLLVVGFAAMGRAFNRQREPIRDMGLVFRPGWQREFGLGAALGWGMLLASILPLVLSGGLIITFWTIPRQFGILLIDLLVLAVAALAEEVAFRGYPFQRLIDAMGPTMATIVFSFVFAGLHMFNPWRQPRQLYGHCLQQLAVVDSVSTHPGALGLLGLAFCLERKHVSSLRIAGEWDYPVFPCHSKQYGWPHYG